ncbi:unnamed protein product [Heligmosomoides polygyrus]|uniref:Endo/exonuclease/phosphatase domain-containing protein n=1 Tax=Heligmosomoides polygyrus TaxID=6339 RepID=A0A3P8AZB3_HELPZ|nr:unnamed protein product [Heligmosomoides polygyrus]
MKIVVAAEDRLYYFFSSYAPQTGCSDQAKDEFWNLLDEKTAEVPPKDVIIVAGDLNGHPWVDFDELLDLQVKRLDHDRKELLSVWCEWSSFFFGLDPTASMAHTNIVCAHLSHT